MRTDVVSEANRSEVARLRASIDEQNSSAERGMYGYAEVGSHEAIISRMEIEAGPILLLFEQGRNEEAFKLWQQSKVV